MNTRSRSTRIGILVLGALLALALLAGCAGESDLVSSDPGVTANQAQTGDDASTAADSNEAPDSAAQSDGSEIPPGRGIAEGGGGPLSYTFREEWRRALPEAQKWRAGAYLISAVGGYVNDDGVPSEWRFSFVDSDKPDAVLFVYMDPWGKVARTEEHTDKVDSIVSEYDKPIDYSVIDSDEAVRIGREVLGGRYNLASTKEPRITLGWSVIDGSGPHWTYMLFYTSTAEYISAQINALTGEVTPQE